MTTLILASTRPAVRKSLVRERVRAMRGQLAEALAALSQATELLTDDQYRDAVAIGTLRAELLQLDQQHQEALACFESNVMPRKKRLTREEQFIVDRNLSDLQFKLLLPRGAFTYYNNLDQERLAGFELFDALGVLQARTAAAEGKHYEALPIVWQQSVTAYMQGCWQSQRMAARHMANESLQLGSLEDAVHHAIMAEDASLIKEVASVICKRNDAGTGQSALDRIIEFANLPAHFVIGCEAMVLLSDYIAEKELPRLFEWLAPRCSERSSTWIFQQRHGDGMEGPGADCGSLGTDLGPPSCRHCIRASNLDDGARQSERTFHRARTNDRHGESFGFGR